MWNATERDDAMNHLRGARSSLEMKDVGTALEDLREALGGARSQLAPRATVRALEAAFQTTKRRIDGCAVSEAEVDRAILAALDEVRTSKTLKPQTNG